MNLDSHLFELSRGWFVGLTEWWNGKYFHFQIYYYYFHYFWYDPLCFKISANVFLGSVHIIFNGQFYVPSLRKTNIQPSYSRSLMVHIQKTERFALINRLRKFLPFLHTKGFHSILDKKNNILSLTDTHKFVSSNFGDKSPS